MTKVKKVSSITGIELKTFIKTNLVKVMAKESRQNFVTVRTLRNAPNLHTTTGRGPKTTRVASIPPAIT